MSIDSIQEANGRFFFFIASLAELVIGLLITWLSFFFVDVNDYPIFFVVLMPIIMGYVGSSFWYRGKHYEEIFGHYPWERKLLSDEDIEDC